MHHNFNFVPAETILKPNMEYIIDGALHQFENLGLKGNLPRVEKFFLECLMLPMNQFISDDDVDYISEKICHFYN